MQADNQDLVLPAYLYKAGSRQIFVHDNAITKYPGNEARKLGIQHYFAERALWLANADDLVIVAESVDEDFVAYVSSLGMGPSTTPIAGCLNIRGCHNSCLTEQLLTQTSWHSQLLDWLRLTSGPLQLNVFCTTPESKALADTISALAQQPVSTEGNPATVSWANQKTNIRRALSSQENISTNQIPGKIIKVDHHQPEQAVNRLWFAATELMPETGKVIIRANYGSGGTGNLLLGAGDKAKLAQWLPSNSHNQQFLVESLLPSSSSPNIQFWIDDIGNCHHVQTTDQRFSHPLKYLGNRFPAATKHHPGLQQDSQRIADWLAEQGLRGMLGLDFIHNQNNNQFHFVEINARFNNSSYATAIWVRINHQRQTKGLPLLPAWQMRRQSKTPCRSFAELQACTADMLYQHSSNAGIIPLWAGALQKGYCSILSIGESNDQVEGLEAEFLARMANG